MIHEDVEQAAIDEIVSGMLARLGEEARERRLGHLAGGHGELAMRRPGAREAGNADVVRRIGQHHASLGAVHQHRMNRRVEAVAAEEPMLADQPEISGPGDSRTVQRLDDIVFLVLGRRLRSIGDDNVDLADREADDADVEGKVDGAEIVELGGEDGEIPSRSSWRSRCSAIT